MVELIAEVSSNHGGDRGLMEAFIAQYADAGADWVKFQSYQVKTLRPGDPQREWLAQAELSNDDHWFLKETCAKYGTKFLTTVFHHSRVPFLASLGLHTLKIGKAESMNDELRCAIVGEGGIENVIVSGAYWQVEQHGMDCVTLYCEGRYPTPHGCVPHTFGPYLWGWSDHCHGIESCELALIRGARLIEKHVSLPEQKRPKRSWEATVEEFRELRQFADDDPAKYLGRWQYDGD